MSTELNPETRLDELPASFWRERGILLHRVRILNAIKNFTPDNWDDDNGWSAAVFPTMRELSAICADPHKYKELTRINCGKKSRAVLTGLLNDAGVRDATRAPTIRPDSVVNGCLGFGT